MTDAEFLQQITASPDDLLLRLVYADWLEERGDPRAEFLRVRTQWSQMSPRELEFASCHARLEQLRQTTSEDWIGTVESQRPIEELPPGGHYPAFVAGDTETLVLFWATWSPPDRVLHGLLARVWRRWYPHIHCKAVNTEEHPEPSMMMGIIAVPTLLWYHGGSVLTRSVGLMSAHNMDRQIKQLLGLS